MFGDKGQIGSRGQLGDLTSFAYVLMVVGIVMGVSLVVLGSFQGMPQIYNNTMANQTVLAVMDSFSTLTGWLPVIVVVVAIAIVMGILGFSFGGMGGKSKNR
jgi:vacuolar-type H+-ATPase subunit I/STV1